MNKDIKAVFGESINNLIDLAQKKWDEAYEKIEKERKFKEECKESRDKIAESINRINDILDLDLTTKEGYSTYMKYLGDLRIRIKDYDNLLMMVSGKTGTEIIDEIAQKATEFYEESQKEIESSNDECKTCKIEGDGHDKKDKTIDIEDGEKDEYETHITNPSDMVDDDVYEDIQNIVEKYVNQSLIPNYNGRLRNEDLYWLTDELVEFGCWLTKH